MSLSKRAESLKTLNKESINSSTYWTMRNARGDIFNPKYNHVSDKWTCTCKAFIFGRECSHIWKAKEDYEHKHRTQEKAME